MNQPLSVKDAVYTLQLYLLDGITSENRLLAAGSLFSRDDYRDVVIERTIDNNCGYPLCGNVIPTFRNRKGRFRISLKEHKVYDLQETYLYCSSDCLVNSKAFAAVLKDERCSVASESKLNEILSLFSDSTDKIVLKNCDLKFADLKIYEDVAGKGGQLSLQNWMGPSNAVEGYVPVRDNLVKSSRLENHNNGTTQGNYKVVEKLAHNVGSPSAVVGGCDFNTSNSELEEARGNFTAGSGTPGSISTSISFLHGDVIPTDFSVNAGEKTKKYVDDICPPVEEPIPKSSIKSDRVGKQKHVVTWADEKKDIVVGRGLTQIQHVETTKVMSCTIEKVDEVGGIHTLTHEAADISSEVSDVIDAAVKAGVGILPQNYIHHNGIDFEEKPIIKWPKGSRVLNDKFFEFEDYWLDEPPDGFSLSLSTFSMMWNALYEWITSSSLAYIYGRDETHIEELLRIDGRECTRKVVLSDGRSAEIKQTISGCLSRALPELVTNLKLPIPLSSLEHGLRNVLDTMSFMWSIPPFRVKQWQIVNLLLIESLSVFQIPSINSHMISAHSLFHKVLEGADVSLEEYEAMKDVVLPLGRKILSIT